MISMKPPGQSIELGGISFLMLGGLTSQHVVFTKEFDSLVTCTNRKYFLPD